MNLPMLTKVDSTGKVRFWKVEGMHSIMAGYFIRSTFGVVDGKVLTSEFVVPEGKQNRTIEEQVTLEMLQMFNLKKQSGYTDPDAEAVYKAPLPMLAHVFEKKVDKHITYPAYIQPKLDGFRCIAVKLDGKVKCYSRKGKQFETTNHIEQELNGMMEDGDVLDGELYKHGTEFESVASSIKNVKKNSNEAQYHVYDTITDENQCERMLSLFCMFGKSRSDHKFIRYVDTFLVHSKVDIEERTRQFLDDGYEGSIIRDKRLMYREGYRSPQLLKYKTFDDDEFEIVGYTEGKGKEAGAVIWKMITKEGVGFDCRPMGTYESRRALFKEWQKYMGAIMTVKFFGIGANGAPRFPVGMRFKEDF